VPEFTEVQPTRRGVATHSAIIPRDTHEAGQLAGAFDWSSVNAHNPANMSTSEPPKAFARQGTNADGFARQGTKSFARQGTNTTNVWGAPSVIKTKGRNTENMTEEIKSEIRRVVPVLSESKYKGQSGKVAVLGGCLEYSSAAYFVAAAALRAGADLSHVFCSDLAAQVSRPPRCMLHTPQCSKHRRPLAGSRMPGSTSVPVCVLWASCRGLVLSPASCWLRSAAGSLAADSSPALYNRACCICAY
jgi:hypothetical protein